MLNFNSVDDLNSELIGDITTFATDEDFHSRMKVAFGDIDSEKLEILRQEWVAGNFELPKVEIRSADEINGANGAFSQDTNTIYLSYEFVTQNASNFQAINDVLLEEIGHYIDSRINTADADGDEGAIFSTLVRGETLSDRSLQQLRTEDDTATINLDNQTIKIEQATYDVGEVIKGLDQVLDSLQNAVADQVFNNELPLLGNTLKSSDAVNFIKDFKDDILGKLREKLDTAPVKTPELVQQALWEALGSNGNGLGLLQDLNQDGTINEQDIKVINNVDDVQFKLKLKKEASKSTFDTYLDTDIGLPSLGLNVNGSAKVGLGYDFDLTFGVNKNTGFYFDTSADSLKVDLNTSLPLNATGKLGLLQLNVTDKGTQFNGSFAVDFKDSDNRLQLSELPAVNYGNLVDTSLSGNANVKLNLATSFGSSVVLPSISSDFNLDWSLNDVIDPALPQNFGKISRVGFDQVKLDLGSFLNNFTRPVLEKVQKIIEPVKPIIDVLTSPIDLKVAKFNLLDIAEKLTTSDGKRVIEKEDRDFIESAAQLIGIVNSIPSSSLQVDLGSFDLGGADIRGSGFKLDSVTPSNIIAAASIDQQLAGKPEASFISSLNNTSGGKLQFPILSDRNQAFNLLLGKNASLFTYDMPKLNFEAKYGLDIPIIPPLGARIDGTFGAGIDLGFGYDTQGIKEFGTSNNPADIFNGFYVSDRANVDGTGADVPEVKFNVGLNAFGSIANIAGVGGGIAGSIGFDLKDDNNDGKVRLKDFEKSLNNPLTMFGTSGELTAGLSAYFRLGVDPFSYTKRFDSPRVTLLDYNQGGNATQPQLELAAVSNGILQLHIGPDAAKRKLVNTEDGAEAFTLKQVDNGILVSAFGATQQYGSVSKIVANGGKENDIIELTIKTSDRVEEVQTPAQLAGGDGKDLLIGGSVNDVLNGDSGWDRLYGSGGNDTLDGGTEDDLLVGGTGADILDGGAGFDIASYDTATTGVLINRTTGEQTGDAAGDVFLNIEQIYGSPYADTLIGGTQNDVISGGDGNDSIRGEVGNDILNPDFGDDTVDGGEGNDSLVVDYSKLPTRAVAWRDYNPATNVYDVFVGNAYGIGTPIKIADNQFSGANSYNVALSADGTTVAWVDREFGVDSSNNDYKIFIKKLQGIDGSGSLVKINAPPGFTVSSQKVSLSADGTKVAFVANDNSYYSNYSTGEIFVSNTDGTGLVQITDNELPDNEVAISGNGTKVAWSSLRSYQSGLQDEIFVANTDATGVKQITDDTAASYAPGDRHPSLSYDGSKVAWTGYGRGNGYNTFVANTDATGIRQISLSGDNRYPSLSVDGSRVAWNQLSGDYQISVGDTNGIQIEKVAGSDSAFGVPSLAINTEEGVLDSEKVAFVKPTQTLADGSASWSLFVGNADGTGTPTLVDTAGGSWNYGNSGLDGPSLSSYVNIGIRYLSFDPNTGSGEIATRGAGRVRFNNVEQFNLTGTRYGDDLYGGNQNDTLNGDEGNDRLVGGLGNDTLTGGAGADSFVFNTPNDGDNNITDFSVADDTILVSAAGFAASLTAGAAITTEQFSVGTAATNAKQRFIYDNTSGTLFFDSDGSDATAQVKIAALSSALTLTNNDIAVV